MSATRRQKGNHRDKQQLGTNNTVGVVSIINSERIVSLEKVMNVFKELPNPHFALFGKRLTCRTKQSYNMDVPLIVVSATGVSRFG